MGEILSTKSKIQNSGPMKIFGSMVEKVKSVLIFEIWICLGFGA
jgi:hypothetical protein